MKRRPYRVGEKVWLNETCGCGRTKKRWAKITSVEFSKSGDLDLVVVSHTDRAGGGGCYYVAPSPGLEYLNIRLLHRFPSSVKPRKKCGNIP